jgi:hypothetical protein
MGAFKSTDVAKHSFKYMHNLLDDIHRGKKIKMVDGTSHVIDTKNSGFKQLVKAVKTQNEIEVKKLLKSETTLTSLDKTLFFTLSSIDKIPYSKAGGSGAGAEITKLSESAVCIAIASLVHTGTFNLDEEESIKSVSGVLDLGSQSTTTEIIRVMKWLKTDEVWLESVIKTAKMIISKLGITASHHLHRDSKFMNSLYTEFQKNLKPLNKIGLRVSGDKWNPSDIWITNKNKISAFHDLTSLNSFLLKNFSDDNIMGVSLKKVGKTVNFDVYNLPSQKRLFEYKNITKPPKPLSSKDCYIETVSGMKMQIRSFSSCDNVQCELKGQHANGGKCGHGALKHIIESLTRTKILSNKEIKKMKDEDIFDEISKNYSKCFSSVSPTKIHDEFKKKSFANDSAKYDFLISKLQALQIASAVKTDKQKNDIVTAIYGYAHSMGLAEMFEASVYAKVY